MVQVRSGTLVQFGPLSKTAAISTRSDVPTCKSPSELAQNLWTDEVPLD